MLADPACRAPVPPEGAVPRTCVPFAHVPAVPVVAVPCVPVPVPSGLPVMSVAGVLPDRTGNVDVTRFLEEWAAEPLAGKADKVPSAVPGNLASLDEFGNLVDSLKSTSDFAPASHASDGSVHHTVSEIGQIAATKVAEVVADAPGNLDTLKEIADVIGQVPESGTVMSRLSALESGKADSSSLAAVATSGSYDDLSDRPAIPAVDATLATRGAAADAKAVGDALRGGFTEWVCDEISEGWTFNKCEWREDGSLGEGWYVFITRDLDAEEVAYLVEGDNDAVALSQTAGEYRPGFSLSRHLITPTKTSQLTNDGDGASPFATEAGLAKKRGLSDRSFVRALSPESYRWSLTVPGGSAVELLPDPNGVQWASGSSDGDYALLKGALVSSGARSWTLVELVSGSPSEVGGCVAAEDAGELDFGHGYVARHVRSEWEADDSLALSSEVDAAVAPKADAADIPYALVSKTPVNGTVTLSDRAVNLVEIQAEAGSEASWTWSDNLAHGTPFYDGGDGVWYISDGQGGWLVDDDDIPLDELGNELASGATGNSGGASTTVTYYFVAGGQTAIATKVTSDPVSGVSSLALPAAVPGRSRDFYLKMTVTGSQSVTFSPSTGIAYTGFGDPAKTYSAGTYLLRFTETAANEFNVADMLAEYAGASDLSYALVSVQSPGASVQLRDRAATSVSLTLAVSSGTGWTWSDGEDRGAPTRHEDEYGSVYWSYDGMYYDYEDGDTVWFSYEYYNEEYDYWDTLYVSATQSTVYSIDTVIPAFTMPDPVPNKARDFVLDLSLDNSALEGTGLEMPAISFSPDTGGTFLTDDGDFPAPEVGRNLYSFTEVAQNVFAVSHRMVEAVS